MGITNPGFKFSNYFDLNYTSSRFYHQTYLAWVTLSGELNLQPIPALQVIEAHRLFHLVTVIVGGKAMHYLEKLKIVIFCVLL